MSSLVARLSLGFTLVALVAASVVASPQNQKKLEPGDKAPSIAALDKWVQGDAPNLNDGVTVVEFWATWCAPCKRAIPHLNKLYKTHGPRGLQVVGIAAHENKNEIEDAVKGVKTFVRGRGEGMAYPVVVDFYAESKRTWMDAAGKDGIPCTFVVGRGGRVLWIGSPLDDRFEEIVKLAMQNKYDPDLTPKGFAAREAAKKAAGLRNWREAYSQLDGAIAVDPPLFGWLLVERYKMTLEQEKNAVAGKAYLKLMLPAVANDPASLEMVVGAICKDPGLSERDLDTAMTYAEQMKRASGSNVAPGLAAIALVHATKGELDKAVEVQTSAWLAASTEQKPEAKRVLDEYQNIKARKAQAKALADE